MSCDVDLVVDAVALPWAAELLVTRLFNFDWHILQIHLNKCSRRTNRKPRSSFLMVDVPGVARVHHLAGLRATALREGSREIPKSPPMEMSSSSERASSEGDGEDVEAVLDCFKGNKWLSMNTDTVSASEKAKRQVSCILPTALAPDHTHTHTHAHTRGHGDGMNIQALHLRAHSLIHSHFCRASPSSWSGSR